MAATKPSKKQRGKQKKAQNIKATAADAAPAANPKTTGLGVSLKPAKSVNHVKFGDDGEAKAKTTTVSVVGKKRGRAATEKPAHDAAASEPSGTAEPEAGGKSDSSPEMIQSAKYYLEQWKKRDQPASEGEETWKFKKIKQLWILRWMFEADVIPKSMFTIVLEYLGGLQGVARQRVLESAHEIIDAGTPEKAGEDEGAEEQDVSARLARRRYKRALQVAELLS